MVQLYIHDVSASITRPVREMKAFQRVTLAPGESRTVEFTLRADDLRFIGTQNRPTVEPGTFRIWVAPSAEADGVNGSFVLA
ncbi:fibronectin type III-like domain-contianing protein [Sphingomonas hankookensis]|uniref:fibronectin type III-like domain-contianing protein n=1 Tax=Sphingomonas hankookensis TaxID=563996 RepID=UPI003D301A25